MRIPAKFAPALGLIPALRSGDTASIRADSKQSAFFKVGAPLSFGEGLGVRLTIVAPQAQTFVCFLSLLYI